MSMAAPEACRAGRPRKGETRAVVPCARCGESRWPTPAGRKSPRRYSGERFGFPGAICHRCYEACAYATPPASAAGQRRAGEAATALLAAAARLEALGPFTGRDLCRETGLCRQVVYSTARRLRADGRWPYAYPSPRRESFEPPDGAPIPPPARVAAAARAARPFGPPRRPTDRLLIAWRRYRKGEPRPLLLLCGLLPRPEHEGDES